MEESAVARRSGMRLFRHRNLAVGGLIIAVLLVLCLGAPLFTHYLPDVQDANATLLPPSAQHLFGTTALGRDLFTRVLYGGRYTMLASLSAVVLGAVAGSLIGLVAAMSGGIVDLLLMRIMDLILAIPGILPALAITAILGPSLPNLVLAIGLSSIPVYARIVASATLQVKNYVFTEAARSVGASEIQLIWRHVLPNVFPQIIVSATTGLGIAVLYVAALGFIGLGVQPPTPEWGTILNAGRQYITLAWWVSVFPGMFITLYIIGINLVGDGLRDVLDPMHTRL